MPGLRRMIAEFVGQILAVALSPWAIPITLVLILAGTLWWIVTRFERGPHNAAPAKVAPTKRGPQKPPAAGVRRGTTGAVLGTAVIAGVVLAGRGIMTPAARSALTAVGGRAWWLGNAALRRSTRNI